MEQVNQSYKRNNMSADELRSYRLAEDYKFKRLEKMLEKKKKENPPVQNFNVGKEETKKRKKKSNAKLMIAHPLLFLLSKKERKRTYKENVISFGYPLEEIPFKYRSLEICKLSAKKVPERFDMSAVPEKYLNKGFYKYCIECKVAISKVPDSYINNNLIKLAIKSGARLFTIPNKYVTKEICEFAIRQNAYNILDIKNKDLLTEDMYKLAFDNGYHCFRGEDDKFGIPESYVTRQMCETIIKENPRSIVDAPKRYLDTNLYNLAVEYGLPTSMVPEGYKEEAVPQKIYEKEVRRNYKNIKNVPENRLNSHIYAIACEGGLSIDDVPKDYVNEEVCIGYVKKTKSIRKVPREYRTDKLYDVLVKSDADNLKDVPFIPASNKNKGINKRTKEMCMEYVKQKHMINLNLFPEKYLSVRFRTALFKDAVKYRDILDGYMDYTEYMRVKSLRPEEQVLCYKDLLKRYLQDRITEPNCVIPSATEEEMQKMKDLESFNIIKDVNPEIIFCKTKKEEEENGLKLAKLIGRLRTSIIDEDPKFNFVTRDSKEEQLKKVASEFYYRFKNISENISLTLDNKNILIETLWFEWKKIITGLDESQKLIFINEMQTLNYKYTKNFEDQRIFRSIFNNISNNNFSDSNTTNSQELSEGIDSVLNELDIPKTNGQK